MEGRGLGRRAGVGPSRGRPRRPGAAAGLRSCGDGRVCDGPARAAGRLAATLRDLVLSARRCAREHAPAEARRRERQQRVVGQPAQRSVSARVAARHDQAASHRIRVGTDDRPYAPARCRPRAGGGGRSRRRPRLRVHEPARPARATRGAREHAPARRAGVVVLTRRRCVACAGPQRRHRMEERSRRRRRTGSDHRLSPAAGVRRPDRALARARVCLALRRPVLGRRRALANGAPGDRGHRRSGRLAAARCGDAFSASGTPRRSGSRVWRGRAGNQGPRVRRVTECVLPGPRGEITPRDLPSRLLRRAVVVDAGRHRWRQRERSSVRRWRARGREGRFFDRAVHRRQLAGRHVGGRRDPSCPARGRSSDAQRDLARAPVGTARVSVRGGLAACIADRRSL